MQTQESSHAFEVTLRKQLWEQQPGAGLQVHDPCNLCPVRAAGGPQGRSVSRGVREEDVGRYFPPPPLSALPICGSGTSQSINTKISRVGMN